MSPHRPDTPDHPSATAPPARPTPAQPGRSTSGGPVEAFQAQAHAGAARHDDATTLEACAARLVSVAPLLMREFRAEMRRSAPVDLSVPLFRSLILAGSRPGATVSDLANHLGVTLPTASVAVAKLAGRGLLQAAAPGQRPKLLLTPAGAELVQRARGDATSAFGRRLIGLAPAALQQIDAALVTLEAALAAGAQGARTAGQAPSRSHTVVAAAHAAAAGPAALASQPTATVARPVASPTRAVASPDAATASSTSVSPAAPADAASAAEQGATA